MDWPTRCKKCEDANDPVKLHAENAELKEANAKFSAQTHLYINDLITKNLAAQARIKVLREALADLHYTVYRDDATGDSAGDALRETDDTAELDALIADAARLDALEFHLFQHQWNDVVWAASKTYWRLAGDYRHTMQHMVGETFREAIDAMKEAKP